MFCGCTETDNFGSLGSLVRKENAIFAGASHSYLIYKRAIDFLGGRWYITFSTPEV